MTDNKTEKNEQSQNQTKLEWTAPELTVISMDKTNSGVTLRFPNEGTFYSLTS